MLPATIKISPEGRAHKLSLHPFKAGRRKCDSQKKYTHTQASLTFRTVDCKIYYQQYEELSYVEEEKSCEK
jgi:hypothetical protein